MCYSYFIVNILILICRLRIKEESNNNTKLELTLTKLENYVKELENKIEIFRAKEFHEINSENMVKVILFIN